MKHDQSALQIISFFFAASSFAFLLVQYMVRVHKKFSFAHMVWALAYGFALALLTSCVVAPVTPESGPAEKPAPITKCAAKTFCWDEIVIGKIPDKMLAANVKSFCPNAAKLDGKKVWLNIVKAIAWAESGWDPNNTYVEKKMGIDPITGKTVESDGLLQLSCQDVINYSFLPSAEAMDCKKHPGAILDPVVNLTFGLDVMSYLAGKNPSKDISNRLKSTGYSSLGNYWSSVWLEKTEAHAKMKKLMPECGL